MTLVLTLARFFRPDGIELSGRDVPGILARLRRARAHLETIVPKALARGVAIVPGTDNMHGLLAEDLILLSDFGMRPADALRAATGGAAEAMGLADETGFIRVGKRADLIVVNGNPLGNMSVMRTPQMVIQAGRRTSSRSGFMPRQRRDPPRLS